MVNCNPETVSTDYDTSDRLYFEPLTLEDVLEIVDVEKPVGRDRAVRRPDAAEARARRSRRTACRSSARRPTSIDMAEDRERFQQLLHELGAARSRRTAPRAPRTRRSQLARARSAIRWWCGRRYVLGGRAMEIVLRRRATSSATCARRSRCRTIARCCSTASSTTRSRSTSTPSATASDVRDRRHHGAHRAGRRALGRFGVLAAAVFAVAASCRTSCARQTVALAQALNVVGLMNVQFAIQDGDVYVLEVNPRASRTVPFVSKATGVPLAKIAARCMAGQTLAAQGVTRRDRAAVLLGEGGGVPVHQVPGRRHDPRPGDEVDRRGDGRRRRRSARRS